MPIRRAGEESDKLYFILDGKVACSIKNAENSEIKANALLQKQQEERKEKKIKQKSSIPSNEKASLEPGTFLT